MRLLADECVPRNAFRLLSQIRNPKGQTHTEMVHLTDLYRSGMGDDVWTGKIAPENPPYLVITGDRGVNTRSGDPRLPALLPMLGVSGIYLSGSLQNAKAFDTIRALLYVWPQLERIANRPGGERHKLHKQRDGFALKPWPI